MKPTRLSAQVGGYIGFAQLPRESTGCNLVSWISHRTSSVLLSSHFFLLTCQEKRRTDGSSFSSAELRPLISLAGLRTKPGGPGGEDLAPDVLAARWADLLRPCRFEGSPRLETVSEKKPTGNRGLFGGPLFLRYKPLSTCKGGGLLPFFL